MEKLNCYTNCDDDTRRLADVLTHEGKPSFVHLMHLPRQNSDTACRAMADSVTRLAEALQKFGSAISDSSLLEAVKISNKNRQLLEQIYELRKRPIPPLSGAEVLSITFAAAILPKNRFNRDLEEVMPYLQQREAPLKKFSPRLLVRSDKLDEPSYISAIEKVGCLVAMDDTDVGSRYFMQMVEADSRDIIYAIAKRYLNRPSCSRMFSWDRQVEQLRDWVAEFKIDGILELPQMYSYWQQCQVPFLRDRMAALGIPFASVERMYHLTQLSQLQTRVQAFVEILEG